MAPSTIGGINLLPESEKRAIYSRYIPAALLERFHLPDADSKRIQTFLKFRFAPGSSSVELSLFHEPRFPDPVLYTHLADTMNGQIQVLLYVLNDPDSPRFDVDHLPDGTPTWFGTLYRNLQAEKAALEAGLAPGQVRRGLGMLGEAMVVFEQFVSSLEQDIYFVEPLYYHIALSFERYGFGYQAGRQLMEHIQAGFQAGGDLAHKLGGSSPFRQREASQSMRLRSWAIHDGILDAPFTSVTMYKRVGHGAAVRTAPGVAW